MEKHGAWHGILWYRNMDLQSDQSSSEAVEHAKEQQSPSKGGQIPLEMG